MNKEEITKNKTIMKETITLNELLGYLSYDVKVEYFDENYDKTRLCSIVSVPADLKDHLLCLRDEDFDFPGADIDEIKPLLLPLSKLSEEHKINIGRMLSDYSNEEESVLMSYANEFLYRGGIDGIKHLSDFLRMINYLYSIHADIHNLIPRGLAIDKSTLKK